MDQRAALELYTIRNELYDQVRQVPPHPVRLAN